MTDDAAYPVEVDELEPLLVATQELLTKYWPYAVPLLQRSITEATHGEMSLEDIRKSILAGTAYLFILKSDVTIAPHVAMAVVATNSGYPSLPALTIVALGGARIRAIHARFWKAFCGWAYLNGVRAIDALVSPAMERILRTFGFSTVYRHVRYSLKEPPK